MDWQHLNTVPQKFVSSADEALSYGLSDRLHLRRQSYTGIEKPFNTFYASRRHTAPSPATQEQLLNACKVPAVSAFTNMPSVK